MENLKRVPEGFELNLSALCSLRVGSDAAASSPLHLLSTGQQRGAVPLFAESRGSFVAGIASIWQAGSTALLCPNPRLIDHFTPNGSPNQTKFLGHHLSPEGTSLRLSPSARIVQVLTSGTSGRPATHDKTAEQLLGEALVLSSLLELSEKDTVLATTASHHVYGLLFGILAPWSAGAKIVTDSQNEPSNFHPGNVGRLVRDKLVTRLVTVPAHLRALCQARPDLAGVTEVICSAAPLAVDDALRFEDTFCIPVRDVLGSTETGGIATRRPARSALWDPLPGVSLQENEDKTLSLVSPFASGSDEAIPTGERGRVSQDGRFEYLGREDGIVKIGGKRLHLREVEDAVRGLSGVTSAFALTRTVSSMRGQELLLVVESERLRGADVKQALQERLDPTFVPRRIRVVGALPHNERGKITREAALALFDYSPESMSRPAFKEDAMDQSKKAVLTNQPEPPRETQAAATMRVLTNSGRFDGHFVELPVYPAVAQIIDLLLPVLRKNFNVWSLAELKRVKWTNPIVPGDEVTVRIQRSDEDAHRFRFEIHRGDEKACVGTAIMMEEREDALSSEETPSR